MKRIIAKQENCIGCGLCEVYCTVASMTLVNCIERTGILYNLMKNKVNLKKPKKDLLRDDFNLAVLPVGLQ